MALTRTSLFAKSQPVLTESESLKTIKDNCPSFRTCVDGGPRNDHTNDTDITFDGCCVLCDCSDACFLKGNCCPGKEQRNVTASRECVQTFRDYQQEYYLKTIFRKSSYILQTTNQISICNEESLAKCIAPNISSLVEITPATSKGSNYRNVFCAKCDGRKNADIRSWPTRISCESIFGTQHLSRQLLMRNGESDFQMLDRLRNASCQIFWDPINPNETESCIHSNDVVSTCMPETEWMFDLDKCQSTDSNQSLTVPVLQDGSIYKNIFCAYCNYASLSQAENVAGICSIDDNNPMFTPLFVTILDMATYNMLQSPPHCLNYKTVCVYLQYTCKREINICFGIRFPYRYQRFQSKIQLSI